MFTSSADVPEQGDTSPILSASPQETPEQEDVSQECGTCSKGYGDHAPEQASALESLNKDVTEEMEDDSYNCCVCFQDFGSSKLVLKPCECKVSYCQNCWDASMCFAPRCPSCRESIGFEYDSATGEAKSLLYGAAGSFVFPAAYHYKPGSSLATDSHIDKFVDEMARMCRPTLLRLLHEEVEERGQAMEGPRKCVCGCEESLRKVSWEERQKREGGGVVCDCCDADLHGQYMWTCERKTPVHLTGFDLCEKCVDIPPLA